MAAAIENGDNTTEVTFEELIDLENDHNAVDTEILRSHWKLTQPLFERRRALIPRIPYFWALVIDEGPVEVTQHVQPSDARFFADYLKDFGVDRFELEQEPRSFKLRFDFAENPHFEDKVLEKTFWWRRSANGWSGLVSEPVKITWKGDEDLTDGLTGLACDLWERWKELGGEETRLGFSIAQEEAVYKTLKDKLDSSDPSGHSFFTLFTFVSAHRYVSASESEEAEKKETERRAARTAGEPAPEPEDDDDVDDTLVTVCPHGDSLAQLLVEELYTSAVKYFTSAHESMGDMQSEADFEEDDLDSEDQDSDSAPSLVAARNENDNKRKAVDQMNGKPAKALRKDS